jgi:hypothetical protein
MNESLPAVFDLAADLPWLIPAVGVAVACFAFVAGKLLLAPRRAAPPPAPAPPPGPAPEDVFLHGSTRERRAAPRRRGNSVEVFFAPNPSQEPLPAWVVDRSVGGLCLTLEQPVKQGEVWHVRPRKAPDSTPWTAVEVRSCKPDEGTWEVGCRFLQTPQWNVMLLFG